MRLLRVGSVAAATAMVSLLILTGSASAGSGAKVRTVVSGLDNPRDLAFSPSGALYVAEAGHGGTECVTGGEEGTACFGFTSGISQVDLVHGSAKRIVDGLASSAGEDGSGATGVDGIAFRRDGRLLGIMTGSSDAVPPGLTADTTTKLKAQLGRLIGVTPPGPAFDVLADVGHADWVWSSQHTDLVPDQFPDANPYGVLAGKHATWVVDAGSNTIDRVAPDGTVTIAAFVPNPPTSDAVPTCIDRGPDGALYVGELTGGGNQPGASVVWRFTPKDGKLTKWATGLTAVTGCGFGADGRFYAVEFSTLGLDNAAPGTGAVVRVRQGSASPKTVLDKLDFPGGFAAGRDGSLFFSDWSVAPAAAKTGAVMQLKLRHRRHGHHHHHH